MKKIYHLSRENLDKKTLQPRIPINYFTRNGYEDSKVKRVCFTSTIDKSLRALSQNLKGQKFYVHIPDKEHPIYKPSTDEVPDSRVTGEVWITEPVRLKCIGEIEVIKARDNTDGFSFSYGDDKRAELYDWDWKWTSDIITESLIKS